MTPVVGRRVPPMYSYSRGLHYPAPRRDGDRWRCSDCGQQLRPYRTEDGITRLRHRGYAVKGAA